MTTIEEKIMALEKDGINERGEFERGWNSAISSVVDVFKKNANLLLEEASETKMMFVDDNDVLHRNKQAFIRNIGKVAAQTRDGVLGMELDGEDTVIIYFRGGGTHEVNIHMDSYAAIIRDCVWKIN